MINSIYFENITEIGNLYFDYCFIQFEREPILFVCKDARKQVYLCICSDIRIEQKWIISKIKIETLRSLINQEVDIFTSLTQNEKVVVVTQDINGVESNKLVSVDQLSELDLPEKGVLLKCNLSDANKYIENISLQDGIVLSEKVDITELKSKNVLNVLYQNDDVDLTIKNVENFIYQLSVECMEYNPRNMDSRSEMNAEKYYVSSQVVYNDNKKSGVYCNNMCITAA